MENQVTASGTTGESIKLKGSFTVEAVFIVPLTVFVTAAVILLIFNLYDRVKLTADTGMFLDEASEAYLINGSIDEEMLCALYLCERCDNFLLADVSNAELSLNGHTLTLEVSLEMRVPDLGALGLLTKGLRRIDVKQKKHVTDRSQVQRIVSVVLELIGKGGKGS